MNSQLTPLQARILEALVGIDGVLTGGGALVGYHLGHRSTRDLDIFWHGRHELGTIPADVTGRLRVAGLTVQRLRTTPALVQIAVREGDSMVPVDLVADSLLPVDPPVLRPPGILVDSAQEILTNKLTALLSRWAVRDLVDTRALVEAGWDLRRALAEASQKDGGFSPPTLAWVLQTTPALGLDSDLIDWKGRFIEFLLGTRQELTGSG